MFNNVFAAQVSNQLNSASSTKGLVDGLVLKPGMVTSGMNNFTTVKYMSSTADECTRGTLSDLGKMDKTNGSLLHSAQGKFLLPIVGHPLFIELALLCSNNPL